MTHGLRSRGIDRKSWVYIMSETIEPRPETRSGPVRLARARGGSWRPPGDPGVMVRLQAIALPEADGGFTVVIPALGCATQGDTIEGGGEVVRGQRPSRYDVDEIRAEPFLAGHTSRQWGRRVRHPDDGSRLSRGPGTGAARDRGPAAGDRLGGQEWDPAWPRINETPRRPVSTDAWTWIWPISTSCGSSYLSNVASVRPARRQTRRPKG